MTERHVCRVSRKQKSRPTPLEERGAFSVRKETLSLSWTCTVHSEFKLPNACGVRTAEARDVAEDDSGK